MTLKSLFAAGLIAAAAAFIPAAPAEAKTVINIGIGVPSWNHYCYNRAGWRCGWNPGLRRYYYVAPGRAAVYYDYSAPVNHRISCSRARNIVQNHGFNRVVTRECGGKFYSFNGRKNGRRHVVTVNSFNGNIVGNRRY